MKFAILILVALLLAVACSGDGRAEPTPSASTTPPPATATEPASTPTPVPPGVVSPASTPGWLTYTSTFGFSLDFPEDWTLDVVFDSQVRIVDPIYQEVLDDAIAAGQGEVGLPPIPGASQFSVIADISPGFDVDQLIGSCGSEALRTTLAGRDAIFCPGTGTVTDALSSAGQSYWIEFPPGHTMLVGGSVISEGAPDLAVVEAILSSFNFTSAP